MEDGMKPADVTELVRASERFWSKVDKRGANECWPWTAKARTQWGYGVFRISAKDGVIGAHRAALLLSGTPLPSGTFALHSCDNPECCNPAHLRAGTPADNMVDRKQRGRDRHVPLKGSSNGRAKLTEGEVRAMRSSGLSSAKVAARWGISRAQAHSVLSRRSWRHVA